MEALKDYDIWYARYTTNASAALFPGAHLWQYDNSGTVPGIFRFPSIWTLHCSIIRR